MSTMMKAAVVNRLTQKNVILKMGVVCGQAQVSACFGAKISNVGKTMGELSSIIAKIDAAQHANF